MIWIGVLSVVCGLGIYIHGYQRAVAGLTSEDNNEISFGLLVIMCGMAVLFIAAMQTYGFPDMPLSI